MKRACVTGGAGFIASHLTNYLTKTYPDCHFTVIDKLSYCANLKNLSPSAARSNYSFHKLDLLNLEALLSLFQHGKFDTVFHLAAYSHVSQSFMEPLIFTQNNVVATHNLLEAIRHYPARFVHISTDEVIGDIEETADENVTPNPTNVYSASKCAAEQLVRSYFHAFKSDVLIIRPNNCYGPAQYPEKVIPKFINNLLRGEICPLQGDGHQTRSFIYVKDVVRAIDTVRINGESGHIYNIGTKEIISIKDLRDRLTADLAPTLLGQDLYIHLRNYDDRQYRISFDKITKLGWKARVTFDVGLKKTIRWYQENPKYWDNI